MPPPTRLKACRPIPMIMSLGSVMWRLPLPLPLLLLRSCLISSSNSNSCLSCHSMQMPPTLGCNFCNVPGRNKWQPTVHTTWRSSSSNINSRRWCTMLGYNSGMQRICNKWCSGELPTWLRSKTALNLFLLAAQVALRTLLRPQLLPCCIHCCKVCLW